MKIFPQSFMATPRTTNEDRSITLSCFSPPVILFTFLVEASFAVYTWFRYRASRFGRLSAVFLALLSLYQLSELFICGGAPAIVWTRIGLIATAFLPIIGIDFISIVAGRKTAVGLGYALAFAFSFVIGFVPGILTGAACTGKFVAFEGDTTSFDILYVVYYLTTLLWGAGIVVQALREGRKNREALLWILAGYVAFMVPTFLLYVFVTVTRSGIGSVLCGFALLLAVIHVLKVLPAVEKK